MLLGRTGIILNGKSGGLCVAEPVGYRCRGCNIGLNGNSPADQYQKQKLIQNTVRVQSSLYTMNLGSLSSYARPSLATYNVGWNQQSDRPEPSVQRASIKTGFNNSLNGRHHSYTSSRPGTQTPGGVGCDIKHNSYDRFLNKLKGRSVLRRGVIPPTFGTPYIPFNRAFPVYGGKQFKTAIVADCNCPLEQNSKVTDVLIYRNPYFQDIDEVVFKYEVGMFVYAYHDNMKNVKSKAQIIEYLGNDHFVVRFEDDGTIKKVTSCEIIQYFPCNCHTKYEVDTLVYVYKDDTLENVEYKAKIIAVLGNDEFVVRFEDDGTIQIVTSCEIIKILEKY